MTATGLGSDLRESVDDLLRRTRAARGMAAEVTDPIVLDKVATIVANRPAETRGAA